MAIVRVRGKLKELAGDEAEHEVDGSTAVEVVRGFERAHPATDGWVLDERGHIRRHINVFVNGEQAAEDTAVGPGDEVEIIPAISGGTV